MHTYVCTPYVRDILMYALTIRRPYTIRHIDMRDCMHTYVCPYTYVCKVCTPYLTIRRYAWSWAIKWSCIHHVIFTYVHVRARTYVKYEHHTSQYAGIRGLKQQRQVLGCCECRPPFSCVSEFQFFRISMARCWDPPKPRNLQCDAVNIYIFTSTCIDLFPSMYSSMCVWVCVCVNVCLCGSVCNIYNTHIYIYIYIYICTHTYIHIYMYMHIY